MNKAYRSVFDERSDVAQVSNQINFQQQQIAGLSRDIAEVSRVAYSGVAMSFAMSGAYLPTLAPGEKTVGVGIGGYQGYGAVALVFKTLANDGQMGWGAGISATASQWGINAGIGWKWR
jgi:autotransporter adhesin